METKNSNLERLEDLSKEKNKKGVQLPDLRKLNLSLFDVAKSYNTIYNKYSKYFKAKIDELLEERNKSLWNMSEDDLNDILNSLFDGNIHVVDYFSEAMDTYNIARHFSKNKKTNAQYSNKNIACWELELSLWDDLVEYVAIPIPRVDSEIQINKKVRKSIYYSKSSSNPNKFKILALEDICAYMYIVDKAYSTIRKLLDESNNKYKPMYFNYFFDNDELTYEDIKPIYNVDRDVNLGFHSAYGQALISEIFFYLKEEAQDDYLENEFNKRLSEDYAKSYQDLKNPTDKILKKMSSNPFNDYFDKVEIDSDVDLEKFKQSEIEWVNLTKSSLTSIIKLPKSKPALRFRKLGQHNATGLYYPSVNCICVDIRDVSSFIHELGHCIDYTSSDVRLSREYDFKRVIKEYKYTFEKNIKELAKDGIVIVFGQKKENYYYNPTEIFARCFEMYLSQSKNLESSFLPAEYNLKGGYPNFKGCFRNEVNKYFDTIFEKFNIKIVDGINTLKKVDDSTLEKAATQNESIVLEKPKTKNPNEHCTGDYIFLTKELGQVEGTIFLNDDNEKTSNEESKTTSVKVKVEGPSNEISEEDNELTSTDCSLLSDEKAIKEHLETETYDFITKELNVVDGSVFFDKDFSFKVNGNSKDINEETSIEDKKANDEIYDSIAKELNGANESITLDKEFSFKVNESSSNSKDLKKSHKKSKKKYTCEGHAIIENGIAKEFMVYTDKKNKRQYCLFDMF